MSNEKPLALEDQYMVGQEVQNEGNPYISLHSSASYSYEEACKQAESIVEVTKNITIVVLGVVSSFSSGERPVKRTDYVS